jgi:hypothetical protein
MKQGGRDCSVGIATGQMLAGLGTESRGQDFPCCPDRRRGPPSHLYIGYRGQKAVLTTHLLLMLGLESAGAIPPLSLCACIGMSWGNFYLLP